jgi:hypothetical protein
MQEHQAMKMTHILTSLLMAALLIAGAARAAETTIQVERDRGTPVASFKIGDAHCVLRDDQVHCTPVRR